MYSFKPSEGLESSPESQTIQLVSMPESQNTVSDLCLSCQTSELESSPDCQTSEPVSILSHHRRPNSRVFINCNAELKSTTHLVTLKAWKLSHYVCNKGPQCWLLLKAVPRTEASCAFLLTPDRSMEATLHQMLWLNQICKFCDETVREVTGMCNNMLFRHAPFGTAEHFGKTNAECYLSVSFSSLRGRRSVFKIFIL